MGEFAACGENNGYCWHEIALNKTSSFQWHTVFLFGLILSLRIQMEIFGNKKEVSGGGILLFVSLLHFSIK